MSQPYQHVQEVLAPHSNDLATVFVQNLAARTPADSAFSLFGYRPDMTEQILDFVALTPARSLIVNDGVVVFYEKHREAVEAHMDYLIAQGLVSPDSKNNLIFVESGSDYRQLLSCAMAVAVRHYGEGAFMIRPYVHNEAFHSLAAELAVPVADVSAEVAQQTIDCLNHKTTFRDFMIQRYGKTEIFGVPRLSKKAGQGVDRALFDEVIAYAKALPTDIPLKERRFLFLQDPTSEGSFGNQTIYMSFDGTLVWRPTGGDEGMVEWNTIDDFFEYISGRDSDLELAPFIPAVLLYGFQGVVTSDQVSVFGPIDGQFSSNGQTYLGWSIDAETDLARYENLSEHRARVEQFGKILGEQGYTGYFNVDLHQGWTGDGMVTLYSEANIRMTAVTFGMSFILENPALREAFEANRLAAFQQDYIPLSAPLFRGACKDSVGLASYMSDGGIKMASKEDPFGALIGVPPVDTGIRDNPTAWIMGFYEGNDVRKQETKLMKEKLAP